MTSTASTAQGIWLIVLTSIISYLFYIVMIQQQKEIDQLQKQVQLHHNLWKQWFEYEGKRRGQQVTVRSPRHVQTHPAAENGEEYLQIDFWKEWMQKALPPGCEDEEFHRKWLLEMDSYFWNRISQERNLVYLNCDLVEKKGLCEQFSQFLEKKLPQFNFTILTESKLISNSEMVLKVVDSSEKLKELINGDRKVSTLDRIVGSIGDCTNSDNEIPNTATSTTTTANNENSWVTVKFTIVNNTIVSCDESSVRSLNAFVWKKGLE